MKGTPRSKEFDDIYFSQEDGLAETEFVFLKGNNLPEVWCGQDEFTIAETGFGTGLNFFAAWCLLEESNSAPKRLNFISFEKYPLSVEEIRQALAPWADLFGDKVDRLLDIYPLRIPGTHSLCISENIFLTLIFDDVNDSMPKLLGCGVDTWFLDGFNPAKNPQMWTQTVFDSMARLSNNGATFATFTAASAVRRGLQHSGFDVEKTRGYGRKRERLIGKIKTRNIQTKENTIRSVAIIGGGLSGASISYWFKKNNVTPTIYEKGESLGSGASGNMRGMVNPRLSKRRTPDADFYMQAYAMAIREMYDISTTHDIEFNQCGALHLIHNEDMNIRYPSMVEHWGWHNDHAYIVDATGGTEITGIPIDKSGLFLPDAVTVNPRKLCDAYASGVEIICNSTINEITKQGDQWLVHGVLYDAVILANAMGVTDIAQANDLVEKVKLYPVRGQMSIAPETSETSELKTILNYRGYLSPSLNGTHALGSTFDRKNLNLDILQSDHEENVSYLEETVPSMRGKIKPIQGRAAFRVSSKYRFPLCDAVGEAYPNLYVSTAHGSHGLISTIFGAAIIHNQLCSSLKLYG